jgi:hypothetical protein
MTSTAASGRALEDLERELRRTPPVSTGFVEYRFSHLLKKPLQTTGTLEYRADGVLARKVDSPYRELTVVTGDTVRIERADKPARTLSLQRAPQMRVMLDSFRALLEGRLAPLAQDFELVLTGEAARWTLTLKPRDARLARQLASIEVFGNGDRPSCLQALEPDGDGAITLLGENLLADQPAAGGKQPTRAELEHTCRAGSGHAPDARR